LFSGDDARATGDAALHVIEQHDAAELRRLFDAHSEGPGKQTALKVVVRALVDDDRVDEVFEYLPMIESKEVRDDEAISIARRLMGGLIFDEHNEQEEHNRFHLPRSEEVTERHVRALLANVAPIPPRFVCEVMMMMRYGMAFGGGVDQFQRELLAIERRMADFYAGKGTDFLQVLKGDWRFVQAPAWLRLAYHFALLNRWSDSISALRRILRTSWSASWLEDFLEHEFRRVPLEDREAVTRDLVAFLTELEVEERRVATMAVVGWIGWYGDPSDEHLAKGVIQDVYAGDSLSRLTPIVDAFFGGHAKGLSERREFERVLGVSERIADVERAATALVRAELSAAEVKNWAWCDRLRRQRRQRLSSGQKERVGRAAVHGDSFAAEDLLIDSLRELDGLTEAQARGKLDVLVELALRSGGLSLDRNRVLLVIARWLIEGEEWECAFSVLSKVLSAIRRDRSAWYARTVAGLREALDKRPWSPFKDLIEGVLLNPVDDESSVASVSEPDFGVGRENLFKKFDQGYQERIGFHQLLDVVVDVALGQNDLGILERALASIRVKCTPERWVTAVESVRKQMLEAGCSEQAVANFERGFDLGTLCDPLETWIEKYRERVAGCKDRRLQVVRQGSFEDALRLIETSESPSEFKLIGILFGRVVCQFGLERLDAIFSWIESLIANRPLEMESFFEENLVDLALECLLHLGRVRDVDLRLGWVNRIWEWDYGFGKTVRNQFLIGVASALAGCGKADVALRVIEGLPSVNHRSLGYSMVSVSLGLVHDEPSAVEVFQRFLTEHSSIEALQCSVDDSVKGALHAAWAFADAGRRDDVVRLVRLVETRFFEMPPGSAYRGVRRILSALVHLLDRFGMVDEWLDLLERIWPESVIYQGDFYLLVGNLRQGVRDNHVAWHRLTTHQRLRFMQICLMCQRKVLAYAYERGDVFKSCIDGCEDELAMAARFRETAPHVVEMVRSMSMGLRPISFYSENWSDLTMESEELVRLLPLLCPYDREANDAYALMRVRHALARGDWETIRAVDLRCPELGLSWLVSARG
jgi:hypothetical protein